jgi:hypothetical protein
VPTSSHDPILLIPPTDTLKNGGQKLPAINPSLGGHNLWVGRESDVLLHRIKKNNTTFAGNTPIQVLYIGCIRTLSDYTLLTRLDFECHRKGAPVSKSEDKCFRIFTMTSFK